MVILSALLLLGLQSDIAQAIEVVKPAADRLNWSAPQVVTVGKLKGYLLQASGMERWYLPGQVPGAPSTGYVEREHSTVEQLLLLPVNAVQPKVVPWEHLPNFLAVLETDLGTGRGFHWYGCGSIFFLMDVRARAGLEAGEDPCAFGLRAMRISDYQGMTPGAGEEIMFKQGDRAVPFLRNEILHSRWHDRGLAANALAVIKSDMAIEALGECYEKGDADARAAVQSGIAFSGGFPRLKSIYADMIRLRGYQRQVMRLAAHHGWSDFLPAIRSIYETTSDRYDAREAYESIDALTAKRLSPETVKAGNGGITDASVHLLLECPDKTYVALVALNHVFAGRPFSKVPKSPERTAKARRQVLSLLDSVPPAIADPLIARFKLGETVKRMREESGAPARS
ncbi:MAG: hypothetical protein ACHQ50_07355 [Fimbriimonadales bacterium]